MLVAHIANKNFVLQSVLTDDFGSMLQIGTVSSVCSFPSTVGIDVIVSLDTCEHALREMSDE